MGNCIGLSTTNSSGGAYGDEFLDALFFPDPAMPCRHQYDTNASGGGCKRKNCRFSHQATSLVKFLNYLRQAKRSMDICVFTVTCDEIANEVLAAHRRGIKVRVITDDDQSKRLGSDIQKFIDAGIPVKDDNAKTHMHHKFCIIDGTLLLNGSFNWSRQAVLGNAENVMVSRGPFTQHYCDHFEELWRKYSLCK